MKFILAIDSFKGCLSSAEANEAARRGLLRALPEASCTCMTLSDGGEGMLQAFTQALGGRTVSVDVHDPLMRPATAQLGLCGKTAIIETAQACGLTLLEKDERNPMAATSFGAGELIAEAVKSGCDRCIIGLGGSATSDGGVGMLQALGYTFTGKDGKDIPPGAGGGMLSTIAGIRHGHETDALKGITFTVASDVGNPLYGTLGAAHVFAPQKGADARSVALLDEGLRHWATVCGREAEAGRQGAGAAGGMGFAIQTFLKGETQSGADLLLGLNRFDTLASLATAVITGEGSSDRQTLMGKLPFKVLQHARRLGTPVWLLAGHIDDGDRLLQSGFGRVACINPEGCDLHNAMKKEVAAGRIAATTFGWAGELGAPANAHPRRNHPE